MTATTEIDFYSKPGKFWEARANWKDGKGFVARDFAARAEAVKAIEVNGSDGDLLEVRVERNIPHCKPDFVGKTLSLDVYRDGKWRSVNIFC